jgi:hypothetical protein
MPTLKKFCPESKKEHSKEIDFCEDCGGERKALLRPIEAIDLTKSTPPSRTTQGTHSSSSKLRFRSAMDHLHQANHQIHLLDKVFNIDAAVGALSVRPTVGPASLTYKVNVTLLYRTFSYTSQQNKIQQIPTTVKEEAICTLFILYYIVRS